MAAAKIFGVEILNEGWGSSIDDAVSEMQVGFVARRGWARQAPQNRSLPPVPSPASFPESLPDGEKWRTGCNLATTLNGSTTYKISTQA